MEETYTFDFEIGYKSGCKGTNRTRGSSGHRSYKERRRGGSPEIEVFLIFERTHFIGTEAVGSPVERRGIVAESGPPKPGQDIGRVGGGQL